MHTDNHTVPQEQMWEDPVPPWVFAGRMVSVREMADLIWPDHTAEKTAFLLKWSKWNE